jgi:hypothetical protein
MNGVRIATQKRLLISALLIASSLESSLSAQLQTGHAIDPIEQQIEGTELKNDTILDALAKINERTDMAISVELQLKANVSDPNPSYRRFTAVIPPGTVGAQINRICELDPKLKWSRYKNTINVYQRTPANAKDTYFVNRVVPNLTADDATDPKDIIFAALKRLPGPLEQIAFLQSGGEFQFAKPWSVSFANLTVREVLDEAAEHVGSGYGWTLSGADNFRVVQFHAKLLPPTKND